MGQRVSWLDPAWQFSRESRGDFGTVAGLETTHSESTYVQRKARPGIPLISFVLLFHYARFGIVFPLVPLLAQRLGAAPSLIGLLVGAFNLLPVFLSVPAGGLTDVFGVRRMFLAGVLCNVANGFLLLVARSFPVIFLAQLIGGLGFQFHVVGSQSYISRLPTAVQREKGFSVITFVAALGQMVGPAVGGWIAGRAGYRAAFAAALLLSAAGLVVLGLREALSPASPRYSLRHNLKQACGLLADPRMRVVLVFASVAIFAVSLRISFLPVLLRSRGLNETLLGLLIGLLAGTSTLVRPFVGNLLAALGRKALLAIAAITIVLGAGTVPLFSSVLPLALAVSVFGIGFGLTQPLSMVMVADLAKPEHAGVAIGVRFTAITLATMLGPVLFGFVVEGFGLSAAFYTGAGLMGGMGAYLLLIRPDLVPGRREGQDSAL
jgi:MFS family permease